MASQTTVNLGFVPKNRGQWQEGQLYYKDNLVQYNGSAFVCNPTDYDPVENPLATVSTKPYEVDPTQLNAGWEVFASDSAYCEQFFKTVENPEFVEVKVDAEDKVTEGTKMDGTKVFGADVSIGGSATVNKDFKVIGKTDLDGISYEVIQSPEWAIAALDASGKVLYGVKFDGKFYADLAGVDEKFAATLQEMQAEMDAFSASIDEKIAAFEEKFNFISIEENPEFIQVTTDSEGKLLQSRNTEGVNKEYVGIETPNISTKSVDIDGATIENIQDPEGRTEIKTDSEGKILSYRDSDGVMHENVGIDAKQITADSIVLPDDAIAQVDERIDNHTSPKNWYLPKFGKVNIKSETFYLTADPRWSTKDDVVCIQMYDDTDANAAQRLTLSYYYIKSTLTPFAGGGYDRTSVNENSVRLELGTGKDAISSNGHYFLKITKVDGTFYLTSTLDKDSNGIYHVSYIYGNRLMSVPVNYTDASIADQTTLSNAYEVKPITDVPPYKAWPVTKMLEHYCIAEIDFGDFYNGKNVPVSIKYQGSGSLNDRKRGFRLTFFKKNDYKKKAKVKIGEMLRLSGFNMKSYWYDSTMVKEPVMMAFFIDMWEQRGKDCYPWYNKSPIYNGATGMIKSFPIETWIGEEFFGLQLFGMKKDEKNYLLDGDDDASGIFVSGLSGRDAWSNGSHLNWEDEMMNEMSQSTADALDEMQKYIKGFIDGTIEIDGQTVDFTNDMLEEHIDIASFIDYYIGLQLFMLDDNSQHNVILYSGADKKMFYAFFYDLDAGLNTLYPVEIDFVSQIEASGSSEDVSLWKKLKEEYKDSILNRYTNLRKTVLTTGNFSRIYEHIISNIPDERIQAEQAKWGNDRNPKAFSNVIDYIDRRLTYLDKNYFILNIN